MSVKILPGLSVGRLTVVSHAGLKVFKCGTKHAQWLCQCSCGNKVIVDCSNLSKNHTSSCGCLNQENRKTNRLSHGHTKEGKWSPLYRVWTAMTQRCTDKNRPSWERYGGRGIRVEWDSFEDFVKDMESGWAPGLSIDRKDNDGNYSKGNCRWATPKEQASNRSKRRWHKKPQEV